MTSPHRFLLNLCCLLLPACSSLLAAQQGPAPSHRERVLTQAEIAWLEAHPVIRVGIDAGYAPYSFKNDVGEFVGLAMDYTNCLLYTSDAADD